MSARVIRWLGERVLGVSRVIDRRCVAVDGRHTVPDELEVVRWSWEQDLVYAAEPSFARVVRLWWPVSYALFWWPLIRLRRLGFWRIRSGEYLHYGWWSYPFDPRGVHGYVMPWEARVLVWWSR